MISIDDNMLATLATCRRIVMSRRRANRGGDMATLATHPLRGVTMLCRRDAPDFEKVKKWAASRSAGSTTGINSDPSWAVSVARARHAPTYKRSSISKEDGSNNTHI
jgi:hypothetical protein